MVKQYRTFVPTVIGRDAIDNLGAYAQEFGIKKAYLVHDPGIPKSVVERAAAALDKCGIASVSYGEIGAEPTDEIVEAAYNFVKDEKDINGVIAIGGGAAMDTAKCVNILLNNPLPLSQYYFANGGVVPNEVYPLIAVPTTSGTGSEQTKAAMVADTKNGYLKRLIRYENYCLAKMAVVDSSLTDTVPPRVTANTGFDAFSHACEAYTTKQANFSPISDALAEKAMSLIGEYLPQLMNDLDNKELRDQMAAASTIAGMATANAFVNFGHQFAHAIGSSCHVPHGFSIAVVLPYIQEFLADVYPEKTKNIIRFLGGEVPEDISVEDLAVLVRTTMQDFNRRIKLAVPQDYNVTREKMLAAADFVKTDPAFNNMSDKHMDPEYVDVILTNIADYYSL